MGRVPASSSTDYFQFGRASPISIVSRIAVYFFQNLAQVARSPRRNLLIRVNVTYRLDNSVVANSTADSPIMIIHSVLLRAPDVWKRMGPLGCRSQVTTRQHG